MTLTSFRMLTRAVGALALVGTCLVACDGSNRSASTGAGDLSASASATSGVPPPSASVAPLPSITPAFTETPGPPGLSRITTISGQISPKSVVASNDGLVFAQNMIYTHTITVYDRNFDLVKTISDGVDLSSFGIAGHPGISQGGPVEAAFTPDRKYVYVSNYSMYGSGYTQEGHDECSPGSGYDTSTVYRINAATLQIDQVIPVGVVPKFLEVTPDGRELLVANWCSYSVSIIDTASGKEIKRVSVGPYPRGIAISPDSQTAYIAIMGGTYVVKLDLATYQSSSIPDVGLSPRHLILDPADQYLYATLNGAGKVVASNATGEDPRSMAMSPDGQFLYVVNYFSSTMTKLRTSDFQAVQSVQTNEHPIGITVDGGTGRVWVADYGGTIEVFADRR
jgi:YVTN family beta-propeller protein